MKPQEDIDKDLKMLTIHEPSPEFSSRVTMKMMQGIKSQEQVIDWMQWIPWVCKIGFASIFLVLVLLIAGSESTILLSPEWVSNLKLIIISLSVVFAFQLLDKIVKRLIVG